MAAFDSDLPGQHAGRLCGRRVLQWLARVLFIVLAASLPACATKPGVIFPPMANAPAWPPPPDAARITYVGKLVTSDDLKPGINGFDALGQALFGKKDSHSMLSPVAVCTDGLSAGGPEYRVFVADSNAQCVHVFDLHTRQYATWRPGKKDPPFSQPVALAWDPMGGGGGKGRLLVSDSVAPAIVMFSSTGQYLGHFGSDVLFQRPVGIAVDSARSRILVADAKAHQVLVLAPDGRLLQRLGSRGVGPGEFNFPTNIAIDSTGIVYVSDSLNFRIQQFDADLKFLRTIGKKGDLPGYFAQPKGIATDSEGHLYVIDSQFENVQIFDREGRILLDFGEEGSGAGQFWLPNGIFIGRQPAGATAATASGSTIGDRIFVADPYNRRLQVFDYKKVQEVTP